MKSDSFVSHHSPWGAYASFVLGQYGAGGGFILGDVQNPGLNVYAGFRRGTGKLKLLPFTTERRVGPDESDFNVEQMKKQILDWASAHVDQIKPEDIERRLEAATETWRADGLSLTFYTPQPIVPSWDDLDLEGRRFAAAPAIIAEITLDNSDATEDAVLFFGCQGMRRPLSDATEGSILGLARGVNYGFGATAGPGLGEVLEWSALRAIVEGNSQLRRLAHEGALTLRVPAGEIRTLTMALGFWREGRATTGYPCRFAYTDLFADLEDAISFALDNAESYKELAMNQDAALRSSGLNEDRIFLVSHARHSYLASTEFLIDEEGRDAFVVNEGEYQMMNTLDLTVDQAFYELDCTPWTVRSELDLFLRRYSYRDGVSGGIPGGAMSFTHDMGVADQFTPIGRSSYELEKLNGCFSYMSAEQLCNWVLTAALYAKKSGDLAWVHRRIGVLRELLASLKARDANGDGVMDADSLRCAGGSEITTYDSLDASLGRARNNLYLAVKNWATALSLKSLFSQAGDGASADAAEDFARRAAATVAGAFDAKRKRFPALLDEQNEMTIIPTVEGLIYPAVLGDADAVSATGRFGDLVKKMKTHLESVLVPGVCIDATSGGWKLSATAENTWPSKIFICQTVAEKILGYQSKDWVKWDAVHAGWMRSGPCASFAATDQINSRTGADMGSRLYPRLVSNHLWLSF